MGHAGMGLMSIKFLAKIIGPVGYIKKEYRKVVFPVFPALRKELLKFFGWQEAAINAVAGDDVQNFSLDAWQWMADTDTDVPGIGVLGENGRSKELRGHIRMGSVKPSNGAKFAVENNAVVGIDIGGGHIIEKKENAEQTLTLQEQGVTAALSGGEATKFYSAIGRIDLSS